MVTQRTELSKTGGFEEFRKRQFPDVQGLWLKAPVGTQLDKGYPNRFKISHILNQLDPKSRAQLRRDYLEKYVREYGYNYGVIPVDLSPSILNAKFGEHVFDKDNMRRDLAALSDKGIGIYAEHDPEIGGKPLRKGRNYITYAYFDPDFRKLYKPLLIGYRADRKNECAAETASNVMQGELSLDAVRGSAENARGLPAGNIDTRESDQESTPEDVKTDMGAPPGTGAGVDLQKQGAETEKARLTKIDITQVIEVIQAGESERGMVSLDTTPTEKRQLREMVKWVADQNLPGIEGASRIEWAIDKVVSMLWDAATDYELISAGKFGIPYLYAARKSLLQKRLDLEKRIRARARGPVRPPRHEPKEPDSEEIKRIEEDRRKARLELEAKMAKQEKLKLAEAAQKAAERKVEESRIKRLYPNLADYVDKWVTRYDLDDEKRKLIRSVVLYCLEREVFNFTDADLPDLDPLEGKTFDVAWGSFNKFLTDRKRDLAEVGK